MKKIKNNEDDLKIIKDIASELFQLLGTISECSVEFDKTSESYIINVDAKEKAGLLIGKKGETINALQVIINQMVRQKKGEWIRIIVNIADFRERENNRMVELANQTAARVRETGKQQNLYNLNPSQRRVIHLTLANEKDLNTQSVGEGVERYLVVSKK